MKTKVYLIGPVLTRSGYGEQARFALRALRSREDLFDIYVTPLQWGHTSWISDYNEEKNWLDATIEKTIHYTQQGGRPDVSVQVTIPNEWKKVCPINIGYTAGIETTRVAHEWIQAANEMDKVVVVSNHSKNVFENTKYDGTNADTGERVLLSTTTPVGVVNYPVKQYEDNPQINLDLSCDINFLSVAQWGPRKNMDNMIRWFVEEFENEEIGLVIKTNIAKNCLIDRETCEGQLRAIMGDYKNHKCKVYLLHGDMTDEEMHSLYKHEKISAFVSIAHGEGFGLPLFESAYSGLPIVTVGWSGPLDFLCDESGTENFYNVSFDLAKVHESVVWDGVIVADSGWAYAREGSYKQKLRECYNDIVENSGFAANAAAYAEDVKVRFNEESLYEQFIQSLDLDIDDEWAAALSKIEIL